MPGSTIAEWVAEKFASGVVGAAGGRAFNEVLTLAGLGGDRSGEVITRLDAIDTKLNELLQRVEAIETQLVRLRGSLQLVVDEFHAALSEETVGQAESDIRTHYAGRKATAQEKDRGASVISLRQLVQLRRKGQPVDVKTFAENVIGHWDIASRVNRISSAALVDLGTKGPLLRQWPRLLISRVRETGGRLSAERLLDSYLTYEAWFQKLLEPQFQGIVLVVAAECYLAGDADHDQVMRTTLGSFRDDIVEQASLFAAMAAEMVTEYHRDLAYSIPASHHPTEQEHRLLLRASLLEAVLRNAVADTPAGLTELSGVYGHLLCGAGDAAHDGGHTFAANEYPASTGRRIAELRSLRPVEWEKDAPSARPMLRGSSGSALNVFSYHFPFPHFPAWPVDPGTSTPFPGTTPVQWYDLDTLEVTATPTRHTVTAGHFLVARYLDPPPATPSAFTEPAGTAVTNTTAHRAGFRRDERLGVPPLLQRSLLAAGTLEVHATYKYPQGPPVGFEFDFPLFTYRSGDVGTLEVGVGVELDLQILETRSMLIDPRLIVSAGRSREKAVTILDSHEFADLTGQGPGARSQLRKSATAHLTVGDKGGDRMDREEYTLFIHVSIGMDFESVPAVDSDAWTKGRIRYGVTNFHMRWV
jgi:hypothetical protein